MRVSYFLFVVCCFLFVVSSLLFSNKNITSQKSKKQKQAQKLWLKNKLYSKKNSIAVDIYKLHLEFTTLLHSVTFGIINTTI